MAKTKHTKTCPVCERKFQTVQPRQAFCSRSCGHTKDTGQRFWSKVEKGDGCWLWLGSCDSMGYGHIKIGGRLTKAHRFSWELANGPIPSGLHALHRCDVRRCVRPSHLFIGTHAENMADRSAKGRGADQKGEANGSAKLTHEQAREIRAASGRHQEIATRFGISPSAVSKIKLGKLWPHLAA